MHLFYTPEPPVPAKGAYFLNEEESKHCIKVLRLQAGDEIYLIDGNGGFFTAEITDPNPKKTLLNILAVKHEFGKRNHYLHIAVAPTKNIERLEWLLEKATEIGIDEITPLICERSERKQLKIERLNKIIVSAVKQSIKAYCPQLNSPVFFKDLIEKADDCNKFIAHCMAGQKSALKDCIELHSQYLILIGPEGDFTSAEAGLALDAGFVPISLGDSRLRTETAVLEACFEINFLNR